MYFFINLQKSFKIKIYLKHSDNPDDQGHDTRYLCIYTIYVLINILHQYTQLLFFNDSFIYVLVQRFITNLLQNILFDLI